jgi:hypothetical protein
MKLQDFTKHWWETKLTDGTMDAWLVRLRATEWDAANRFQLALDTWPAEMHEREVFKGIMEDERRHSLMVERVLLERGIPFPQLATSGRERYWEQVWPRVTGFRFACAALAFGETLAITRFRVIIDHPNTPDYVRELIERVVPDERRHINSLTRIAGIRIMNEMREHHENGMQALNIK